MATKRAWDLNDHRRFAERYLPPDEFRDGYLGYLDEIELKEPAKQDGAEPGEEASPAQAGAERQGWPARRYVLAAVGSVVFAFGTWALTSMR